MRKAVVLILSLSFLLCSCEKRTISKKQTHKSSGHFLARVDGWEIKTEDFKKYLSNINTLLKSQKIDIENYGFKKRILEEIVRSEILAQIAIEKGKDRLKEVIEAIRNYRNVILAEKIREDLEKTLAVSLEEVKSFYNQNPQLFVKSPKEVKIREIVLNNEAQAKKIHARLIKGEDFSSLAGQLSVAESAKNKGDLGFIEYFAIKRAFFPDIYYSDAGGSVSSALVPPKRFRKFWEEVLKLDKGKVSQVFKGEDGKYYIVKVEDTKGGDEVIPFSEAEKYIEMVLKQKKLAEAIDKLISEFKQKHKVEINYNLLEQK